MKAEAGRECYHCKEWVTAGEAHDCWTTTEAALTRDLPEDLHEAWERLREVGASLGDQRIYASHNSIMFARRSCYFFVRPKKSFLEVCVFADRALTGPQVRRSTRTSKTKVANILRIRTRTKWRRPSPTGCRTRTNWPAPRRTVQRQSARSRSAFPHRYR